MIRLALFASGSGTNVENIATYFKSSGKIKVQTVFCNNPKAYVLDRAKKLGINSFLFNRNDLYHSDKVLKELEKQKIDFIVLAGFLWLIPQTIIKKYPRRIINIHPALLPRYGGKGMYGMNVHKAVIAAGEKESGITIHYVNEQYDQGAHILQAKVQIQPYETPESLAQKVHQLEYLYFPKIIEQVALSVK